MKDIEVKVLNPEEAKVSEKMMVCAARLTQSGHLIKNVDDFMNLYNKDYKESTAQIMSDMEHTTLRRLNTISIVLVNISRRALMQLRTYTSGITFVSASCQYSNWKDSNCVIPYEIIGDKDKVKKYVEEYKRNFEYYKDLVDSGINHDDAAYALPMGLRNVLIMSATTQAWRHIINQRSCRRNTTETRYITLKIWDELYKLNPILFGTNCGPYCMNGNCKEGRMSCGIIMDKNKKPSDFLKEDFPKLYK